MSRRKSRTEDLLLTNWQDVTPYERLLWEHAGPGGMRNLLKVGLECFAEAGFHGTSTREIASRAGMSPTAMYVHFKSKEELLFHIAMVLVKAAYETLAEVARIPGDNVARLHNMARAFTEFHARMAAAAGVTNFEIRSLNDTHRKSVLEYYLQSEAFFRTCLEEGRASGDFHFLNLSATLTSIMSVILSVCRWYQPGGRLSPEAVGRLYADMVVSMARSETVRARSGDRD